ncbi:hypothetical protein ACLB2K_022097 [Fragaria x ananassa]
MVCTGAKSEVESELAARKCVRTILKMGFDAKFKDFKIQNMVAICDVRFPMRLEGAKRKQDIHKAFEVIHLALGEFKKLIDVPRPIGEGAAGNDDGMIGGSDEVEVSLFRFEDLRSIYYGSSTFRSAPGFDEIEDTEVAALLSAATMCRG